MPKEHKVCKMSKDMYHKSKQKFAAIAFIFIGLASQQAMGIYLSFLSNAGITCIPSNFLNVGAGDQLRFTCLHGKHFIHWTSTIFF